MEKQQNLVNFQILFMVGKYIERQIEIWIFKKGNQNENKPNNHLVILWFLE